MYHKYALNIYSICQQSLFLRQRKLLLQITCKITFTNQQTSYIALVAINTWKNHLSSLVLESYPLCKFI